MNIMFYKLQVSTVVLVNFINTLTPKCGAPIHRQKIHTGDFLTFLKSRPKAGKIRKMHLAI